jgi:hypothetical protein
VSIESGLASREKGRGRRGERYIYAHIHTRTGPEQQKQTDMTYRYSAL